MKIKREFTNKYTKSLRFNHNHMTKTIPLSKLTKMTKTLCNTTDCTTTNGL